jgi:hypothetical protein
MKWAGHVARMGEERKVYKVLVGKPEGKRPLGRPRRRWEDGIRIWILGRLALGCGLDSTGSRWGPVAGCCECGDEPSVSCAMELFTVSSYIKQFHQKCISQNWFRWLIELTRGWRKSSLLLWIATLWIVTLCNLVGNHI